MGGVKKTAMEDDTRSRVLRVAWQMIDKRHDAAITLVDVAREAGLSRQTLYLLFGNRAGLLLAMVDDVDARSPGPGRLQAARETTAPPDLLEAYARAWLDYVPVVFPVARALIAAARDGDTDAQAAWESRAKLLRNGFLQVTRALHAAGALRPEWTPATAAEWMFSQTHVDAWQHLVVEARWKPKEAVDRIVATLRETLLVEGAAVN